MQALEFQSIEKRERKRDSTECTQKIPMQTRWFYVVDAKPNNFLLAT